MASAAASLRKRGANAKVQLFPAQFHPYLSVNAKVQLFGSQAGKYAFYS
jgi:hypothetical protein